MNKTILSISLFLVLAIVLAACGNNSSETESNSNKNQEVSELTNKEKAVAVLESLESGEKEAIESFVSSETYIQHKGLLAIAI